MTGYLGATLYLPEVEMGKINWARVIVCGIVAGLVWTVLTSLITTFFSKEFVAAVPGGRLAAPPHGMVAFLLVLNLLMGMWAIWLYAAIRPRYGPGIKTAAIAGFAWWFIAVIDDSTWGSLGFVPLHALLVPVATSLPALVIAAVAGAWLYRE
jgi:hypothetical protein